MNRMESLLAESSPYYRTDRFTTSAACSGGGGQSSSQGSAAPLQGHHGRTYARSTSDTVDGDDSPRRSSTGATLPPIVLKSELDAAVHIDGGLRLDGGSVHAQEKPTTTQVVGDNCVVLTYFAGDIASNINEHFTRALSSSRAQSTSAGSSGGSSSDCSGLSPCERLNSKSSCCKGRTLISTFIYIQLLVL